MTEPESREEWGDRVIYLGHHDFFSACGEHKLKFEIVDRDILKLSGTRLDRVGRKGDVALFDARLGKPSRNIGNSGCYVALTSIVNRLILQEAPPMRPIGALWQMTSTCI